MVYYSLDDDISSYAEIISTYCCNNEGQKINLGYDHCLNLYERNNKSRDLITNHFH